MKGHAPEETFDEDDNDTPAGKIMLLLLGSLFPISFLRNNNLSIYLSIYLSKDEKIIVDKEKLARELSDLIYLSSVGFKNFKSVQRGIYYADHSRVLFFIHSVLL